MRLTRSGFLRYATYRQAVFAGLVTNTVFGFLRTAIVRTVFTGSARVAGYDPTSAVTFVWVGQGLAVVLIFGKVSWPHGCAPVKSAPTFCVLSTCRRRCLPRTSDAPVSRC